MILAALLLAQANVSTVSATPGWQYSEGSSVAPFGEKVSTAAASLMSEGGDTRLMLKCDRWPKPALSIQLRRVTGSERWRDGHLDLIHDDRPASRITWQTLGDIAFSQDQKEVREIAKILISTNKLTVRGQDLQNRAVQSAFQVSGAKPTLERVFASCGAARKLQ